MPKTTPFSKSYSSFAELTGKLHQFHELSLALYEHNIILLFTTADRLSFHTVWTGYATAQSGALFLGRRCCEILLPFSFRWQPNIATTKKSTSSPADGVSTSLDDALRLHREVGDKLGEANAILNLGELALRLLSYADAQTRFAEALPLYRASGRSA